MVHAVNGGSSAGSGGKFELERGKHKDVAFMVMDLAARDYDYTKLSIGEAVHIVRCIATALDHAHASGIIHRDLKPENILGTIHHPLLTDFGIAKEIDQSHGLTRTGQIIGTLDYMSPEQATDAKRVDHRSDIYSLGVVLYEFATQGSLPYFHKIDRESCLTAIRSERVEPKWPREYVPRFPIGLERIVLKSMAYRMEDRYQTMTEFVTDLDRFTRGEWVPMWGRVRLRSLVRYEIRRHPRLFRGTVLGLISAALIVLAIVLLPWFDSQGRSIDAQLDHLEKVVERVEKRKESQPNKDDLAKMASLDLLLKSWGDRYPAQSQRRAKLEQRLRSHRWLEAHFTGVHDGQPTPEAAMEQLRLAARAENPSWGLVDREGLYLQELAQLNLGPYGAGVLFLKLTLKTTDGFQLRVSEEDPRPRHVTTWTLQNHALTLVYQEDEKPPVGLRQDSVGAVDARFSTISIALEVSVDGIRTWSPHELRPRARSRKARAGTPRPAQGDGDQRDRDLAGRTAVSSGPLACCKAVVGIAVVNGTARLRPHPCGCSRPEAGKIGGHAQAQRAG
jgi:serine/threonine protein kinase